MNISDLKSLTFTAIPINLEQYSKEYYIIQDMKRRLHVWCKTHSKYGNDNYLRKSCKQIKTHFHLVKILKFSISKYWFSVFKYWIAFFKYWDSVFPFFTCNVVNIIMVIHCITFVIKNAGLIIFVLVNICYWNNAISLFLLNY